MERRKEREKKGLYSICLTNWQLTFINKPKSPFPDPWSEVIELSLSLRRLKTKQTAKGLSTVPRTEYLLSVCQLLSEDAQKPSKGFLFSTCNSQEKLYGLRHLSFIPLLFIQETEEPAVQQALGWALRVGRSTHEVARHREVSGDQRQRHSFGGPGLFIWRKMGQATWCGGQSRSIGIRGIEVSICVNLNKFFMSRNLHFFICSMRMMHLP